MTYRRTIKTTAWCVENQHRLRVKVKDLRKGWLKMNAIDRKNRTGLIRAFCPNPKCPEHNRTSFVGTDKIPNLGDFVNV